MDETGLDLFGYLHSGDGNTLPPLGSAVPHNRKSVVPLPRLMEPPHHSAARFDLTDPDAAKRGVTALTDAIAHFDGLKNQPRGNIVNRSTLLREVETRIAELMEANRDLDDLALQFDGTEAGQQFISAWKQAGIIVDAGHGIPTPATPPTP